MSDQNASVITVQPTSGDNDDVPHISIAFWRGETDRQEVDLVIHRLESPDEDAPASNALLAGVAILALERQGYIDKAVERMWPNGRPTEKEATDYIDLLLTADANAIPA